MRRVNSLLAIVLLVIACQETNLDNKKSNEIFNKKVGSRIPIQVALRWIDLYEKKQNSQGRTKSDAVFSISANQLTAVIQSVNTVGLSFNYALDYNNDLHIVVSPLAEGGT